MPAQAKQKQAFEFLAEHFETGEPFARVDLQPGTDWTGSSIDTYWGQQFKPFVMAVAPIEPRRRSRHQRHRVTDAFRPYAKWTKFREHVTQVRRFTSTDYTQHVHDRVLIYEFYMPLTNEGALRTTLDALFYKNTLLTRIANLNRTGCEAHFPRTVREGDEACVERLSEWLARKFVGYSVSHVGWRFRAEPVGTVQEAAKLQARGGRYLIDETTAVTRFIFPCEHEAEAEAVRWFFQELFVNAIIQVVNAEDEIWMVESGMRNRLHIWKIEERD